KKVTAVQAGDLCAVVGLENFQIGETIADHENPEPLAVIAIDEPTMNMQFSINNSPFFGKEGKFVTSRHIRDRLMKELEKNLRLRVKDKDDTDTVLVYGRGKVHLRVLIKNIRGERYEHPVGQTKVLTRKINEKK